MVESKVEPFLNDSLRIIQKNLDLGSKLLLGSISLASLLVHLGLNSNPIIAMATVICAIIGFSFILLNFLDNQMRLRALAEAYAKLSVVIQPESDMERHIEMLRMYPILPSIPKDFEVASREDLRTQIQCMGFGEEDTELLLNNLQYEFS